jgi:competence protein ComEA
MRVLGALVAITLLPLVTYASIININTADAKLLDSLPGIGPTKAAAIVEYRSAHGAFRSTQDIQKVHGIGPVTFSKFKDLITVDTSMSVQPPPVATSSYTVQKVETAPIKIKSGAIKAPSHENAVLAPTAVVEPAAVGAALPEALPQEPVSHNRGIPSPFHSPWILGLVAVVVLAGGAFILL